MIEDHRPKPISPPRKYHQGENNANKDEKLNRKSKYHREIKPGVFVDVYDVLVAFDVTYSSCS